MILRMLQFGRFAALLLVGLGFSAVPASADCGYGGCYAAAPVVVQPYYYQSCSCCGCGSAYYTSYYPAYTYPTAYYGYQAAAYGCGGCGYGYGYGAGYAYQGGVAAGVIGPRYYRPRVYGARYLGPRRFVR